MVQADRKNIPRYRQELFDLHAQGKLQAWVDEREFVGVESVVDAIEYMLTGEAIGKGGCENALAYWPAVLLINMYMLCQYKQLSATLIVREYVHVSSLEKA